MPDPRQTYMLETANALARIQRSDNYIDVLNDLVLRVSDASFQHGKEIGRKSALVEIERKATLAALSGSARVGELKLADIAAIVSDAFAIGDAVAATVARRLKEADAREGRI